MYITYYRGELFDSVDVDVFPREVGRDFTLPFICETFAYGPCENISVKKGINEITYA